MKRIRWLALLAVFAAACGPLPVTVDLLPSLRQNGLDQQQFAQTLDQVPPNTDLSSVASLTLELPNADGLELTFDPPELPANPTSVVLDFKARISYAVDCVFNLGGTLEASAYLAPESPPWSAPLEGLSASLTLRNEDTLVLEGRAELSPEQIDAILTGQVSLGLVLSLSDLSGRTGNCSPTVSGEYRIERAVIEVRFL